MLRYNYFKIRNTCNKNDFSLSEASWSRSTLFLTICLLVSSADNLCKQFGPRSDLIWIKTVWHSDDIPERSFFLNLIKKKTAGNQKS